MKKSVLMICFFISACAAVPNYNYKITSLISDTKGKTIKIESVDKNISATQLKEVYREKLKNEGFKVVEGKANYTFIFGNNNQFWQTMQTVPTYGVTGVNSINTYDMGNGNSVSYVNHSYGINGYQNVVVDHHIKSFNTIITDNKTKDIVYESSFVTTDYITDDEFIVYLLQVQNQYPMLLNTNVDLFCYDFHCEVPYAHTPTLWGVE